MVSVRRFEPEDAAATCELVNTAIQSMDGLNEPARALIAAKNVPELLAIDLARCFALVAMSSDGLEGVGVLDGSEVKRMYVHPRRQRQGIGTMIFRSLEAEARNRGLSHLELQASPSSVPFYALLGFREQEKETTSNGYAEFTHVRMSKDLD
jgi:GNAT superfamily N-acetyltransferase